MQKSNWASCYDATCGDSHIRFRLPTGELVPAYAHVTEVARISKRIIDCGGTFREDAMCRLQTWVADDYNHRLNAGKLAEIIGKAQAILNHQDLEVDIEHDLGYVTQFPLTGVEVHGNELILVLQGRNTACLAPELCCPPPTSGGTVVALGRRSKQSFGTRSIDTTSFPPQKDGKKALACRRENTS